MSLYKRLRPKFFTNKAMVLATVKFFFSLIFFWKFFDFSRKLPCQFLNLFGQSRNWGSEVFSANAATTFFLQKKNVF